MLVISRKIGEQLVIGDTIVVQVLRTGNKRVQLGIEAPRIVPVRRSELPLGQRAKIQPLSAIQDQEIAECISVK